MPSPGAQRTAPRRILVIAEKPGRARIDSALASCELTPVHCTSIKSALARAWREPPDAVLLHAQTLTRAHARHVRALCSRFPSTAVLVLAAELERWELRAMLAAGASAVLAEDELLAVSLPVCVQATLAGHVCVPRRHRRQLAPPALSTREKQILGLVVMGYMNCQIAERLYLAESTVKSHLSSAFTKLGVRSRNEAASLILDSERGLGTGILALSHEQPVPVAAPA